MNKNSWRLLLSAQLLTGLILLSAGGSAETIHYAQDPAGAIRACRACHDNPWRQPLLRHTNPTAHHLLHNTPIRSATAPNAASDKDGLYDCMTCHTAVVTDTGIDIQAERDCLKCHDSTLYWPTEHHRLLGSLQLPEGGTGCAVCHAFIYDEAGRPTGIILIP